MPTRIFMMYCHCCKVTILANSRRCHGGSGSERAFHEHEPVAQVGWHFAVRSDFAEAKALGIGGQEGSRSVPSQVPITGHRKGGSRARRRSPACGGNRG